MIYVSLDIETLGLNPETCDVIEVGAYLEDTENPLSRRETPSFHKYLWKYNYRGEPYAMAMHTNIFKKMLELKDTVGICPKENGFNDYDLRQYELIYPESLWPHFKQWIYDNRDFWPKDSFINEQPKIVIAGKNVAGFDLPFLSKLPEIPKFHHRVIDPGMMFFDPRKDQVPPDLKECKRRAAIPEAVSHEALDDAWDVIELVRAKYIL